MTGDTYVRRASAVRDRLRDVGANAAVLFPSRNLQYVTGHDEEPGERHFFCFLPADGEAAFFVPELAAEQVCELWVDDVRTWADEEGPTTALRELVTELGLGDGHLLVDDTMWARFTQDLRDAVPDATFGLASEAFASLRVRKDETELAALRAAADVADAVVADVRADAATFVGLTESELARRIERRLEEHGGTGVSFEPIVAAGENGAKPHHRHGDREIRAGEPVVLDFGTRVDGYPSDVTRTFVLDGEPEQAVSEVHRTVREAQQAAVEAVEPGAVAGDVDAAARDVIRNAGYGEQFVHRTGHGVGLDVHEEPYIVAGNERKLEPGMVFSVEPGVYLPGEFGVRIEDLVVVTDDGCERLNRADRNLRC